MNPTALFKVNYGVYIVSSKSGDKLNGQIGNTVFQVTADPPQIAISINKDNLTHEFIEKEGVFSVSILSSGDSDLEREEISTSSKVLSTN